MAADHSSEHLVEPDSKPVAPKPVPSARGSETVVNPERRHQRSSPAWSNLPVSTSHIWNRLFPPESELLQGQDQDPSGIELGHFVIEARIGMGGMGAVFRALDTRLQRVVALKVLSPAQTRDSAAVQRFQNEGRAAAKLDHDNIARVYYIGEENGLNFIAFEFVTGTNVRDLIHERNRLAPAEAVNYTLQIASALRHTSAAGVIHRDIKPSNVIITPSGRAKLVDLGLARKIGVQSAPDLTLAGTTLGTFDYISPEQAKDPRNVDVRSDIYSLGCTLYHMLVGKPPYPEGTVLQKLLDHQGKGIPDAAEKCAAVSPALSAIVKKMMASDPHDRYATPDALIRDLMAVAGSLGLQGLHPEGLVWVSPKSLRGRAWERNLGWAAMATVLLLIVLLLQSFPQIGRETPKTARPKEATSNPTQREPEPHLATTSEPSAHTPKRTEVVDSPSEMLPAKASGDEHTTQETTDVQEPGLDTASPGHGPLLAHTSPDAVQSNDAESSSTTPALSTPTMNRPILDGDPKLQPLTADFSRATTSGTPGTTTENIAEDQPPNPNPFPPAPETVAAATSPSDPLGSPPTNASAEDQTPVWVIDSNGNLVKKYPTLEAACAEAQSGRIIELHFDGHRREKPIRITDKNITLRAARNYHPVVEFVPTEMISEAFPLRMLSVIGGRLELNNVSILLSVPDTSDTEQFSMFSVEQSEQIRLRGVTVTIDNPNHRPATMFELTSEATELSDIMGSDPANVATEFEVSGCFLRGECDLFSVQQTKSCRFILEESGIAVDGSLLRLLGSFDPVTDDARVDLRLEHVTCLLGNNLVEMDCGDSPRNLPPLFVLARNNIFATPFGGALIAMKGNLEEAPYRPLLTWTGERNYFDQYQLFWTFASGTQIDSLDQWRQIWGPSNSIGPNNNGVTWNNPGFHTVFSHTTHRDLTLEPDFAHSAMATDGNDVGAALSRLPLLPEQVEPSTEH